MQWQQRIPAPPARPAGAHKGSFGTVVVVGGSDTMIGAPALAATSAFRSGAGLVKLAVPRAILPFAITIQPGATGIALPDEADQAVAAIEEADAKGSAVLAIGPGIGQREQAWPLVRALLQGDRPVVLDADGLNLLAAFGQPRPDGARQIVLTPHPGEFARLAKPLGITHSPTDPDQRPQAALELARAHRAVVLLKGAQTIVTDGKRLYRNPTGSAALGVAGTGDVLTGLIAALIAQGLSPFDAAVLGACVGGEAAELWTERTGPSGMTAIDLANLLPEAFEARRSLEQR